MRKLLTFLFICASIYSQAQVAICGGSSTTLSASNPSNLANPQYSMNPGGFFPVNGNQFVVSPNVTTTYTIYTTGTNTVPAMVTTTQVITVQVNPQPISTPTLIQPSCTSTVSGFNLGLTFSPANPAPQYTINWSGIPNGILSGQQTSVASGVLPGPYTATITTNNNCVLITSFTLNPAPAPANFTLTPFGSVFTITCVQPTIDISASDASYTYTWSSSSTNSVIQQSVNLNNTNLGTWTVVGQNPGSLCTKTYTFQLIQNITPPQSTVTPLSQVINCSLTAAATVSVFSNPTVNIGHFITDPQGGVFSANSHTAIYTVDGPGTYTHCLVNLENGCEVCKTFTVTTTEGYPTFGLSSPDNFTLGCNTKSVATINIINAVTQPTAGGPISYTIIGPGTSTTIPTGTLSALSQYTINTPGTWTIIVKDNTNNCQTRSQQSILQNTIAPTMTVEPSYLPVLDCDHTVTILRGLSETPNISSAWSFTGVPGTQPGFTISANIIKTNTAQTVINNYTLTFTDNSSTCRSTTVVPIQQNIFPPKVGFSLGTGSISCATPTIVLTNTSSTGIPPNTFPVSLPVIGYLWEGPTPQEDVQVSTTYVAGVQGTYTLTGKDLNNGCIATGTMFINDFRDYPVISITNSLHPVPLDCGSPAVLRVASNPSTGVTYFWPATVPPTQVGQNGLPNYTVTTPNTYTVIVTNSLNACVSSRTLSVINGSLTASFDADRKTGFAPLTVNFTNNSSSVGNASITTVWNFGNGTWTTTSQASLSPQMVYTQPGTYSVAIHAIKGSCKDTAYMNIVVNLPSKVSIPNVFTPNGDGINDLYFLNANQLTDINFVIIDRWGHVVYELPSSTTGNIVWDGKNQAGVEVAEGTYFYVLKATGADGVAYDEKGNITLLR